VLQRCVRCGERVRDTVGSDGENIITPVSYSWHDHLTPYAYPSYRNDRRGRRMDRHGLRAEAAAHSPQRALTLTHVH
jgi:hypothetical protein